MRTNLAVEDLGDLLDEPLLAVLATLRKDGSVLLSPVYFEWREGGFGIWVERDNVKARWLDADGVYRKRTPPVGEAPFRVQQHLQDETRRLVSLDRERKGVTFRPEESARPPANKSRQAP